MKKNNKIGIYLGCLSALMLSGSMIMLDEIKTDHTDTLCTTTKFLNMIDKTGELGMKHQLSGAVKEKDVIGVKYVDDCTKAYAVSEVVDPTVITKKESKYVIPEGCKIETDEQGKKYAVYNTQIVETTSPIITIVDGKEILTAPEGYYLTEDSQGNAYCVRIVVRTKKEELPIVSKTINELVVPEGYTLETDEQGNTYGRKTATIHEDLGPAILSTYKNGNVKTLLLDKRN